MATIPTLESERIFLRPFQPSDAAEINRLAGDRAIADTTLNIPHPYNPAMAESWIALHQPAFEKGKGAAFAIVLRSNGTLLGAIDLINIDARFQRAEIGYWIGVAYWKQGYCTEAAKRVLEYGFIVLGLNRIQATHLTRNPASGRVMQKISMTHEGRLRQSAKKWDKFEESRDL